MLVRPLGAVRANYEPRAFFTREHTALTLMLTVIAQQPLFIHLLLFFLNGPH
jgi:hypothetical protein